MPKQKQDTDNREWGVVSACYPTNTPINTRLSDAMHEAFEILQDWRNSRIPSHEARARVLALLTEVENESNAG